MIRNLLSGFAGRLFAKAVGKTVLADAQVVMRILGGECPYCGRALHMHRYGVIATFQQSRHATIEALRQQISEPGGTWQNDAVNDATQSMISYSILDCPVGNVHVLLEEYEEANIVVLPLINAIGLVSQARYAEICNRGIRWVNL